MEQLFIVIIINSNANNKVKYLFNISGFYHIAVASVFIKPFFHA